MKYFMTRYLIPKKIKLEVASQFLFALDAYAPEGKGGDTTLREITEHLAKELRDG